MLGDETALPAIAKTLQEWPSGASGRVFVEIPELADKQELELPDEVTLQWLPRSEFERERGRREAVVKPGELLVEALEAYLLHAAGAEPAEHTARAARTPEAGDAEVSDTEIFGERAPRVGDAYVFLRRCRADCDFPEDRRGFRRWLLLDCRRSGVGGADAAPAGRTLGDSTLPGVLYGLLEARTSCPGLVRGAVGDQKPARLRASTCREKDAHNTARAIIATTMAAAIRRTAKCSRPPERSRY